VCSVIKRKTRRWQPLGSFDEVALNVVAPWAIAIILMGETIT
jgi:hypothetical protein